MVVSLPMEGLYGNDKVEIIVSRINEEDKILEEIFRQNITEWK